jgi:HAD superfamily hydrolase (TIGR01549 family)
MSPVELVIFDLDGTLTVPYFNFKAIRQTIEAAVGQALGEPLLERILQLDGDARRIAFEILEAKEDEAAIESQLNPGADDVLVELRRRRIPTAVLSRNRRRAVDTVLAKHALAFDLVASRDDGPIKPDPRSVTRIIEHFRIDGSRALMVGDYKYDIEVGRAAGTRTCLLTNGTPPSFTLAADHVIHRLVELLDLV